VDSQAEQVGSERGVLDLEDRSAREGVAEESADDAPSGERGLQERESPQNREARRLEEEARADGSERSGPFKDVNLVPVRGEERGGGGSGGARTDDGNPEGWDGSDADGCSQGKSSGGSHQFFMGIGTLR
jgi:hypothetical protein